ncbi:MAG: methyltransferase family protein [Bacteroidales bacterium]
MREKIFLIAVIVCIICHMIRLIYELLKHKKMIKANRASFVIIFTNMAILWVSWVIVCIYDTHRIELANMIRYLGISLVGIGLVVFLIALFTIKTLESYEGDLITTGVYSKIRHPMYFGFILWLAGLPIYFGALYAFILAFLFIANVLLWRYLEEKELIERFPAYTNYKKTTLF